MDTFEAEYDVHSPRWGHPDGYQVCFTPESLVVRQGGSEATCTALPQADPEWHGYNDDTGNPLMNILENNGIYVSRVIVGALEHAWRTWNDGDVSEDDLRDALAELFSWIDNTARNQPRGFWSNVF